MHETPELMGDLVLRGGRVVDGDGHAPALADVLVRGDRIVAVEPQLTVDATREIDVTGRLVLPGFVDAHSHADTRIADPEVGLALLRQGVTTVVVGQDGVALAPTTADTADDLGAYFSAVNGPRPATLPDACGVDDLLDWYDGGHVNVAVLVPGGNVRAAVVGFDDRPATLVELARMRELVAVGLAAGAVGLSTGLEYVPGGFAEPDELVALCATVAEAGAVHVSHMRGYEASAATALTELRGLADRSGVATHVSHLHAPAAVIAEALGPAGDDPWDLTFDSYPYLRGSTLLAMLALPPGLQAGRPADTLTRLADPATVADLARSWFPGLGDLPDRITLAYVAHPDWAWAEGRLLTDVARELGLSAAALVCRILVDARLGVGCLVQQPSASTEADLRTLLADPRHMVGSDGIFLGSAPHPRARGAIARFVARHVVELGDWSWAEAVRHLSTHAVDRFGLGDRGRVRPGAVADLVVLDPGAVADRASYEAPLALATGVDLVLIGGELALKNGEACGRAGRAIRRGRP